MMRSIFLEGIPSEEEAVAGLGAEFAEQPDSTTKVVFSPDGKRVVGYLYVARPDDSNNQTGPYMIMADYSAGDLDCDAKALVLDVLRRLQSRVGGNLRDYDD